MYQPALPLKCRICQADVKMVYVVKYLFIADAEGYVRIHFIILR